jgi:acyl-CoA thioester hydrolase
MSTANHFVYALRVHIEDTDFSGVVYHSNYLKYMERARSEWLATVGAGIDWQRAEHIGFVVHSAEVAFMRPARLHEKVEVVTSVTALRNASIVFAQHLHSDGAPDKILCRATIKVACVDNNLRPRALPDAPIFATIRRELS